MTTVNIDLPIEILLQIKLLYATQGKQSDGSYVYVYPPQVVFEPRSGLVSDATECHLEFDVETRK